MDDFSEIIRYLVVGCAVTAGDLVIYSGLTGRPIRLARIPANVLSVTCGMILGFTLHFAVVFHPQEPLIGERLVKYVASVGLSVYGVQNVVIFALAELWRSPVRLAQGLARAVSSSSRYSDDVIDRMVGKIAAAAVGMTWNYAAFKFFVYA